MHSITGRMTYVWMPFWNSSIVSQVAEGHVDFTAPGGEVPDSHGAVALIVALLVETSFESCDFNVQHPPKSSTLVWYYIPATPKKNFWGSWMMISIFHTSFPSLADCDDQGPMHRHVHCSDCKSMIAHDVAWNWFLERWEQLSSAVAIPLQTVFI